jgi:hypothetical protein
MEPNQLKDRAMHEGDNPLIIYCFKSRLRIFHLYGDVTIAGEG